MLIASKRRQRRRTRVQRPQPHWFTMGSFRSLGRRLWNPPPSFKEERYAWFIAPRYYVSLEDVIADKHPSPLSRQDFEDYLCYAEGSAGNLYFHDWVYNYRRLYNEWTKSVLPTATIGLSSSSKHLYPARELWERLKDCQDRQLRDEFSYAKATFFQPGASMRLNIDTKLRDRVLLIPNLPPSHNQQLTDKLPSYPNQPEPGIFDPILEQVDKALEATLSRFVRLAFCNAGLWHFCLGHLLGACILAAGLALWSLGVMSLQRSASGVCLGVYSTGDARQLYPWELAKPVPGGAVSPPILSIAPVPNDRSTLSSYSFGRKPSTISHLLPLASPPLPSPELAYQPRVNEGRRWSEGVLRIWGRHKRQAILRSADQSTLDRRHSVELYDSLPPARRTKNLPRTSLVLDVEQAYGPTTTHIPSLSPPREPTTFEVSYPRRNAAVDLGLELQTSGFGPEGRPDSPFTEENDFGIVLSDVYEADTPHESSYPASWTTFAMPTSIREEGTCQPCPPESLDRLAPLIQAPELAVARRQTMPDIYTPTTETLTIDPSTSRRGSKSSDLESGGELYWPWPRTLLGPMTLVHSPLVRRAHWVTVWRTAAIAAVVTCGMTLGLIL
ncbi:RGS domain protein [Rhizoctonia solani 123E]|uniref:RGS domain protein n=1 Tax=Rhizoctonia solani 123E TaxID=1423351 RepID=A0A074S4D5_9AGAM|nr:RGS domain protein [Rhizoctonia solani 123E]